jgi:uncharacterized protein (DUF433 family)
MAEGSLREAKARIAILEASLEQYRTETKAQVWFDVKRQSGRPCIYGTRIPVGQIIACLLRGQSEHSIRKDYNINAAQVEACRVYTLRLLGDRRDSETD